MTEPANTQQLSARGERFQRPLLIGFLVVAIIVSVIGIGVLSFDLSRKIKAQETASSDNVQWSLSQIDVEFLGLGSAVDEVVHGRTDLKNVRKRFDVFYSRMNTMRSAAIYAPLKQDPDYVAASERVWAFLDRTAPLIDGPDEQLAAALPAISLEIAPRRLDTRQMALTGISVFSELSDREREGVARSLTHVAALTVALVLSLLSLIVSLLRLDRVNRRNVERNRMTLARLEAIVTTALDGVIVADRSGAVIEFNPAAETIFGYARDEAVGAQMGDLIIPDHLREAHRRGMERYLATGERRVMGRGRVRLEARKKDGSTFPVEVTISRAMSDRGEIFVSFLRDLSAQVAAEQELLKARDDALAGEKAKAELLAVMSHEMRTPLNGMLGTMELMEDTELSPKQREYLRIMGTSGRLLLHHVNDVLDISRLESGKMPVERLPVDLEKLIGDIIDNQQSAATTNGNRLSMELPADGRNMVTADPVRLRQILLNLAGNANKFTRNGEISVEVEHLDHLGQTEFRVIDTGIGIAPEDLDRIFEDFVTLDASYSRSNEGTGLGLGIARRLVHAMGGQIGAESEPGEGSIFWVRLPLEVLSQPRAAAAAPAHPSRDGAAAGGERQEKGLNVLIVEDNPVNRLVVREFLLKDGHKVDEAHDGEEGVRFAASRHFDLILMDISMPRKDGVTATEEIRKGHGASSRTPIVALTAHALPEESRRFLEAGMQAILNKPVTRKALNEMIQNLRASTQATQPVKFDGLSVMDQTQLDSMAEDLGSERFLALLADFAKATKATVDDLEDGTLITTDPEAARRIIHKLSGSAGVFGATALNACLAGMETSLKSNQPQDAADRLKTLALLAAATQDAIESYRAQASA